MLHWSNNQPGARVITWPNIPGMLLPYPLLLACKENGYIEFWHGGPATYGDTTVVLTKSGSDLLRNAAQIEATHLCPLCGNKVKLRADGTTVCCQAHECPAHETVISVSDWPLSIEKQAEIILRVMLSDARLPNMASVRMPAGCVRIDDVTWDFITRWQKRAQGNTGGPCARLLCDVLEQIKPTLPGYALSESVFAQIEDNFEVRKEVLA